MILVSYWIYFVGMRRPMKATAMDNLSSIVCLDLNLCRKIMTKYEHLTIAYILQYIVNEHIYM